MAASRGKKTLKEKNTKRPSKAWVRVRGRADTGGRRVESFYLSRTVRGRGVEGEVLSRRIAKSL